MSDALIVVDVQNDFCEGGALAVPGGGEVVPVINRLLRQPAGSVFGTVVFTQDWHPAGHKSFAGSHPAQLGLNPFDVIRMPYGEQVLWPGHCIQETEGANFHPDLDRTAATLVIRKGMNGEIDSYSAFRENDKRTATGLAGYLRERGVERVFLAGLALDFCVRFSAIDARELGFQAVVIDDACRAIDADGSLAAAMDDFDRAGVDLAKAQALS
jgi:nicotinamidase/pyrazinamidase